MNYLKKPFGSLETCVSVNNLCGKLVSSLEQPITFDERFKVTSVPFLVPDFNLLSWELDNFTLHLNYYIGSFYTAIILKQTEITIL